ncbi:DNRLRE domain-containing protein, partial [Candidatus Pacearchaeota archaeon]|nr:DNRLRE domain-containing protein [Candidatus Pacearchaeota archaeon]
MVYKKFIKKDGKLYGPYLYHSVKKDGKVTTNYLGKHSEKKIVKGYNFSFIKNSQNRKLIVGILSIMLIVLLIYLVFVLQFGATGKASLDIQSVYAEGENLKGQVNLILKQGELFPTDSQVVIDNVGKVEQYLLDSLIYNEKVTGDFYVEGQNISGYGEGYGIPGNKEVFPQVLFSFRVVPSVSLDNDSTGNVSAGGGGGGTGGEGEFDVEIVVNDTPSEPITNETPIEPTINESASVNETPFEEPPQSPKEEATPDIPIQEPPVEEIIPTEETTSPPEPSEGSLTPSDSSSSESTEDSTSSETSSDSDSSSEGASITGEVTAGEVIEGIVSKNSPYEYILPEGVDVEVINGSHPVSFSIVDGKVIFTTDYSEMQQGFGQEFIGNERLIIPINLTELGILARNGVLTISFIYSDIELTSSSKEITVISNDTINNSLIEEIPLSIELNVTGNISDTISAIQFDAVLGQPVKWKVIVKPDKKGEFIVKLPKEAENIYLIVADETLLEDGQVSMINETGANAGNETQNSTGFGITGGAVTETTGNSDLNISSNESLNETIDSIKVESKERFKEVVFDAKFKEYSVEYETPAPYSIEEEIPKGERIKVIGPETVHYKDVLIFTNLSENLNVKNPGSVTIYWVEKDIFVPIQDIQDKNNNGVYDYIEFIAPELSNQTFEIIVITKAEHLDENKTFVSDIYEQVKELDGVWSETIPENHFVRVTFEQNLTSENDITIYPKIVNGTPRIEVYEFNGSDIIATFESLNSNEYNKVFLTGLAENHSQDTFDLRVLNGSVEFDHIIDPIVPITEFFEDCVSISEWTVNSWYVSNQWCEATNTNDEAMTYGPINLSDPKINYANLSIYLNNSGFEGFGQPISKQDFLYFDISNNSGVSWTNLITSGDSGFLKYYSKNISSFVKLTSNMYIRARCVTNTDDFCRWDNMSITSYKEDNPPSVTLVNPIDGFVNNSYPINVSFTCNVIDDIGIANVSLYTNTTGSWALNQTAQIFSPISDVTNHYSTVYLGNGIYRMTFQPDGTYGKDTFVWEANPDTNYGNDDLVIRNNFDSDPLLEFNLSQIIGGNITVIGANLTLVRISGGDMEAGVYRITQTWGESSVTWNTRPSRDSFLYDQKTISSSATSVIFNITNLVQEWVNGTYTNYGLFISYPGSGSSFVVSLNSSDTGDSTTRPKLVIDYKVKDQYSANFTINNIGQGSYIWNCRAFDTFPSSSFAPANYTFYVDPCLPPTDGDWNIAQNCIVSNRIITLARDKNIQINNPGSLSLINTTLIINGSSNGVSNIDVNNGGNISLASNSEIKSANTNKFGFNIWETAKISMANSTLRSALSFAIYGKINNFTGNYLNNSPINVYTSHNVIKSSTFEKSNLKLTAGESEDSTNNTVDGNNFVGSFLIVDSTTFSSYNNTIINNIFESSVSGTFGAIHVLSSYNLIKNNTINRATYGIRFSGISVVSNNNVINNLVANSTNAGILTPITGGAILDNLFYGNVLINNSKGISIVSSADDNNLFVDNVILNNTNNDIENTGNNNTFLNTTFNKSKVSVTGGYINVQWYLDVNVNDYGAGVNQANVTGANVSGQRAFSTLTNNQGNMTPRQNLTEYFRNSSHIVYHTNYTINVTTELSPPGTYLNNYSGQLNITNNTLLNVFLHRALQVDTCYPSSDKVNLRITQTVICNDTTIAAGSLNVTSTGNLTLINTTLIVGNTWVSAGGRLYINNSRNTIWQNGNLTIGGKYILQNSTLRMNGTSPNGAIGINVTSTGNMNITESSNITNGQDANYKYFFIVNTGSIFSMDNSYLSYAGWDEAPGAYGLQISTTVARFEGNTLKNNYIGVILYVSNNNIIKSNLIAGNLLTGIGILTGNNNTLILNNVTNNPYGIAMDAFAGNNYIISNNFSNNDNAIYISGSSNNLVTSSLLKDNPTGIFFAGVSSNNLIRDSNIINSSTRNIYTEGSGNNIFLNTSFNKSKVNFLAGATGKINVQWYLDVNVTDYYSGNVLSGVNVSAWN